MVLKPVKRVVKLVRVSTAGQKDANTPASQRAQLERMGQSVPHVVVEVVEHQESGALGFEERQGLQRLQEWEFDELWFADWSRVWRHADLRGRASIFRLMLDKGA